MLVIGAKGFAKEVLEIFYQNGYSKEIAFFDNVNTDLPGLLYNKFSIINNFEDAKIWLIKNPSFCLGLGNPTIRFEMAKKFIGIGGVLTSLISPLATIGHFGTTIGFGSNIMTGTVITNDISIGEGVLINFNCYIAHDSIIGDYTEISPGSHILGNVKVGSFVTIGTSATILPKIIIGNNVIIGAGAVVTKNISNNTTVVGIPAKPIK